GLDNQAVKRGGPHKASANYADAAQRVSRIRAAMPAAAAVPALEDHSGSVAGGQQTLLARVIGDRADVLVRKAVHDMLPGRAGIGTPERAFAGSHQDFTFRREFYAVNAGDVGRQRRLLPGRSVVGRAKNVGASGGHQQLAVRLHRNKITLAHYRTAGPGFALVRTGEQSRGSGCEPALGGDFDIAYARIQN